MHIETICSLTFQRIITFLIGFKIIFVIILVVYGPMAVVASVLGVWC